MAVIQGNNLRREIDLKMNAQGEKQDRNAKAILEKVGYQDESLARIETDGKNAHDQIGSNIDRLRKEVSEAVTNLDNKIERQTDNAAKDRATISGMNATISGMDKNIDRIMNRLMPSAPASAPAPNEPPPVASE